MGGVKKLKTEGSIYIAGVCVREKNLCSDIFLVEMHGG